MRKLIVLMMVLLIVMVACSSDEEEPTEASSKDTEETNQVEVDEKQEDEEKEYSPKEVEYYEITDPARPLTEYEKELLRKPGLYSGDNYDEEAVNAAIDQLPDDLTTDQYVDELIYLLTEDYHEEIETFVNFNPNVETSVVRPDGSVEEPTLRTAHYAILIDASGSMAAYAGDKTRWQAAQEAVTEFAEEIPENATLSLRMYGHKGTGDDADKALSCESTENFYNDTYDADAFNEALHKAKPAGWTPIALGLEKVREDIPESIDDAVVYVVSDGFETCDGDPIKAASELVDSDIQTAVNIIGFDVDNEGQKLLKEVADAGDGEFVYVGSETQLKDYMTEQYEAVQKQWIEWKEEGKKQSREIKEEKKELATETKESMKEKSRQEKERLKEAQEYLKDRFEDYDHPARKTFSPIIDYSNDKWSYAVDIGNTLWSDSVDSGNKEWQDYVDEGNEKAKEAREKKNEQ